MFGFQLHNYNLILIIMNTFLNIFVNVFIDISYNAKVVGIQGSLYGGLSTGFQSKVKVENKEIDLNAPPNFDDEFEHSEEDNNNEENCGTPPRCLGASRQEIKKTKKRNEYRLIFYSLSKLSKFMKNL